MEPQTVYGHPSDKVKSHTPIKPGRAPIRYLNPLPGWYQDAPSDDLLEQVWQAQEGSGGPHLDGRLSVEADGSIFFYAHFEFDLENVHLSGLTVVDRWSDVLHDFELRIRLTEDELVAFTCCEGLWRTGIRLTLEDVTVRIAENTPMATTTGADLRQRGFMIR